MTLEHVWLTQIIVNVGTEMRLWSRLRINSAVEAKLWHNTYPRNAIYLVSNFIAPDENQTFLLDRADGVYTWGSPERFAVEGQLGYFPYKYNPDARNLGEFLFRGGVYPAYLLGEFDFPLARLAGLRIGLSLWKKTKVDLLVTPEIDFPPFGDITLSGLLGYTPWRALSVQAGISLSHLISVSDAATTPMVANNSYLKENGDTAYYTFKGTKLMGRITLDPKRIFLRNGIRVLDENDLRIYAEAAVLGLKNYPASAETNPYGYGTLAQKVPVLLGATLPCFRILDVLAIEAEWYGCRYANSYQQVVQYGYPLPMQPFNGRDTSDYRRDDWKWSVYAKRSCGGHFALVFQAARDHSRHLSQFVENVDREEMFHTKGQWYWMAKAQFSF